ncbi:MAG: glycosyltransferase [Planctomycetaceae bacterium]|jgi:glycosyltransferase involved in cell wall biosynthesis|nr:glycosyltransferase [Planctomycetaceae bacterium]
MLPHSEFPKPNSELQQVSVLHVFGNLGSAGGAEKWFLELFKLQDPRIHFDFVSSIYNENLHNEITSLGSQIHYVPFSHSPLPLSRFNPYLHAVRKILQNNSYNAIHVHQFDLAGEILRIAQQENIQKRIMTLHASAYHNTHPIRNLVFHTCGQNWIRKYATNILPCSQLAAKNFNCTNSPKTKIIPPAINTKHFNINNTTKLKLKNHYLNTFNIPQNKTIIGHIGRFTKQKNHHFLIQLLSQLIKLNKNIHAILIGTGELLPKIKQNINKLNLQKHITLAEQRNDVPNIIASMFDVLVLPSLYEGLPTVALEALATGLAVVYSDKISPELEQFFPARIFREQLKIENWLNTIPLAINAKIKPQTALNEIINSPFSINSSLKNLAEIYGIQDH